MVAEAATEAAAAATADVDEAPAAVMTSAAASTTSRITTRRTRPPPVLAARIVPPGPAPPLYHNRSGRFAADSAFFLLVPANTQFRTPVRLVPHSFRVFPPPPQPRVRVIVSGRTSLDLREPSTVFRVPCTEFSART